MVKKLRHRTVTAVNRAVLQLVRDSGLPFKTITWDKGTGFHGYKVLEEAAGVRCYFAYTHRPWERDSNENLNGLLRQYFPKRKSLAHVRQRDCDHVTQKLNSRPRKRYGYQAPIGRLNAISGAVRLAC